MASVKLGKYRLIAELGRGGMAEVFLAVTTTAGMLNFAKLVVIKKPRAHLAEDAEFVAMFVDEARIAARLNHPNLVQTLEVGEAEGSYFLTMEYLDGQPLHRVLSRTRAELPLEMHLTILSDVLGGIHNAHELKDFDGTPLKIVHRDVTPHNVFITYDGQVKVVDFGIAKAVGRAAETRHGIVKGKMAYMAPEQAAGREIDRRVDVFCVGIMLYEAIVRERMWKGISEMEIVKRLVEGNILSSPKALVPDVDDELDRICKRALAVRPDDRYETAAAFQRDLDAYLAREGRRRPSGREIGEYVANKFADKRDAIHGIIEKQLAEIRKEEAAQKVVAPLVEGVDPSLPNIGSAQSTTGSQEHFVVSGEAPPSSSTSLTSSVTDPPAAPSTDDARRSSPEPKPTKAPVESAAAPREKRDAKPIIIAFAVALLVAGGVAVFRSSLRAPAAATPPPASSTATAESAAEATADSVTVTLRAAPAEARFTIDDGPPLENPYVAKVPKDDRQHRIRVRAPGYVEREEVVAFQNDVSFRFALARADRDALPDQ